MMPQYAAKVCVILKICGYLIGVDVYSFWFCLLQFGINTDIHFRLYNQQGNEGLGSLNIDEETF
jgi:hypothetical protein